jgi:hypothetical protein
MRRTWFAVVLVLGMTGAFGAETPQSPPSPPPPPLSPAAVKKALAAGRAYLKELVGDNGMGAPTFGYPLGSRALYAAALCSAGEDPQSPFVRRLFDHLATLPMDRTYAASLYAIALECRFKSLAGTRPGRMAGPARKELERAVTWLTRAQGKESGGWSYLPIVSGRNYDLSNTQFAVLALGIGFRHGIEIPRAAAQGLLGASLKLAEPSEGTHELLVSYQLDWSKPSRTVETFRGKPCGWRYSPSSGEAYFSMTAATVGSLLIAKQMLPQNARDLDRSISEGLVWLDRHWKELTDRHERPGTRTTGNYFYTVWTLEKACDLGDIGLLGEHDWFQDEARYLIASQREDGSWGEETIRPVATAFALLFLSRAQSQRPNVSAAPCLLTGPGAAGDRDRVFVAKLKGYVSARGFLTFVAESADPKLLDLAAAVVDAYSPDARDDLIPPLRELLASKCAPIRDFALRKLKAVTGLKNIEKLDAWCRTLEKINAAEATREPEKLCELVTKELNGLLLERLLTAAERLKARKIVPQLIAYFLQAPADVRARVHRTLCFLTGQEIAYDARNAEAFWRTYRMP